MSIAARLVCTILIACAGVGAVATSAGSETRVGKGRSTQEFDVADKSSCPADAQKAAKDLWPMGLLVWRTGEKAQGQASMWSLGYMRARLSIKRLALSCWDDKAGRVLKRIRSARQKMTETKQGPSGQTFLKAELHVHIEGAAHPELVHKLAERHGKNLDAFMRKDGSYIWSDFTNFLECYDKVAAVICTPEDYADLTEDYLLRNAAEGCFYTEFFLSPDHVAALGMSYENLLEGITEGYQRAKDKCETAGFPIDARFIVTCLRHMGPDAALDVAKRISKHPHPLVTGFGMGGDERLYTQRAFAPAFEIAHEAGLFCYHPCWGVWRATECQGCTRPFAPLSELAMACGSIEDEDLVKRLSDEGIVLEVCPHSNVALGLYPDLQAHPLKSLMEAGVLTTLSSDDPPFFSTSIGKEYDGMQAAQGWDTKTMLGFTRRSLEAAFVDADTRARLHSRLEAEV